MRYAIWSPYKDPNGHTQYQEWEFARSLKQAVRRAEGLSAAMRAVVLICDQEKESDDNPTGLIRRVGMQDCPNLNPSLAD